MYKMMLTCVLPCYVLQGMQKLINHLSKVAHKWYAIGLQLGVDRSDLDKIRGDRNDAKTCLSSMLSYWLDNNPDAHRSQILEMLAAINEQFLARRLVNSKGNVLYGQGNSHWSAGYTINVFV